MYFLQKASYKSGGVVTILCSIMEIIVIFLEFTNIFYILIKYIETRHYYHGESLLLLSYFIYMEPTSIQESRCSLNSMFLFLCYPSVNVLPHDLKRKECILLLSTYSKLVLVGVLTHFSFYSKLDCLILTLILQISCCEWFDSY